MIEMWTPYSNPSQEVLKTTNKMTHQPDSVQVVIANVVTRSSALAQTEKLQKTKFALWL